MWPIERNPMHRARLAACVTLLVTSAAVGCVTTEPNGSQGSAATEPPDSDAATTDGAIDWDVVGADAGFSCFVGQPRICDGGQFVECWVPAENTSPTYVAPPQFPGCQQIFLVGVSLAGPTANEFYCCP